MAAGPPRGQVPELAPLFAGRRRRCRRRRTGPVGRTGPAPAPTPPRRRHDRRFHPATVAGDATRGAAAAAGGRTHGAAHGAAPPATASCVSPVAPAAHDRATCPGRPSCGARTAAASSGSSRRARSTSTRTTPGPRCRKPVATIAEQVLVCRNCGAQTETDDIAGLLPVLRRGAGRAGPPDGLIAPEAVVPFHSTRRAPTPPFRAWVRSAGSRRTSSRRSVPPNSPRHVPPALDLRRADAHRLHR